MYKTSIDLPLQAREAMARLLNARLADAIDLALQVKQAHWNVKGPNFIALHQLFDTVHAEVEGHYDTIAERITDAEPVAVGPLGRLQSSAVLWFSPAARRIFPEPSVVATPNR